MPKYYVNPNAQNNGDHEVHEESCTYMLYITDPEYLGVFPTCHGAVAKAKEKYPTADGCKLCSLACHTS